MLPTLLFSILLSPSADATPLSKDWHGTWAGTLKIGSGPKAQEVPMSLEIQPIDGGKATWTIQYGKPGDDKASTRKYEIVPTAGKPGRFEIDEKNGIRITAKLTADGTSLASLFRVGGQFLQTKYTLKENTLCFELMSYNTEGALKTSPAGSQTEVEAFELTAVQTAELKHPKN
jgi:hypothetical protein